MKHRIYEATEHVPVKFMESYTRTYITSEITGDAMEDCLVEADSNIWWVGLMYPLLEEGKISQQEFDLVLDNADMGPEFITQGYIEDDVC